MALPALTELVIVGDFAHALNAIVREQNDEAMKRRNALRYGRKWRLRADAAAEAMRHMHPAAMPSAAHAFTSAPSQEDRPVMSRLTDKLAQAAGVTRRATEKIEARADAVIAREGDIDRKTERAFAPHEAILTEAERGLDEVENALRLLANDPLPS